MKATRGNRWSLRTPMLLAAVSGVAMSLSGCIIDGTTGPIDSDGDGIADIYDLCPGVPEDYNGFQDNDGCPDGGNVCLPDLTIRWRIISMIDNQVGQPTSAWITSASAYRFTPAVRTAAVANDHALN